MGTRERGIICQKEKIEITCISEGVSMLNIYLNCYNVKQIVFH